MSLNNKFIIWTADRSGSTHLSSLLDSHPNIICCRELFFKGEANVNFDYYTKSGVDNIHQFLDFFFGLKWGIKEANLPFPIALDKKPKAIGFKLKYNQAISYPEILTYLQTHQEIKIINLTRTNLLHKCVSKEFIPRLLRDFQKTNFMIDKSIEKIDIPVEISAELLMASMQYEENQASTYSNYFTGNRRIDVRYEELVGLSKDSLINHILHWLGVKEGIKLYSKYKKILPKDMSLVIKNWDSVKIKLKGTKYEDYVNT